MAFYTKIFLETNQATDNLDLQLDFTVLFVFVCFFFSPSHWSALRSWSWCKLVSWHFSLPHLNVENKEKKFLIADRYWVSGWTVSLPWDPMSACCSCWLSHSISVEIPSVGLMFVPDSPISWLDMYFKDYLKLDGDIIIEIDHILDRIIETPDCLWQIEGLYVYLYKLCMNVCEWESVLSSHTRLEYPMNISLCS